jgi:hypothetical protein
VQAQQEVGGAERLKATLWVSVSLVAVTMALTMLFLGMRAVMDVGGFCAEGGPFVIGVHCPEGIPLVMVSSIWGGLIAAGVYAWATISRRIPSFVGLLWPALFLSLGWNFLEYGLDPPGDGGVAVGWLVCAALFFLMGGPVLFVVLPPTIRAFRQGEAPIPPGSVRRTTALRTAIPPIRRPSTTQAAATVSGDDADVVSRLERLDRLHRAGSIDDAEYEAAKERVLGEDGS